MVAFGVRNLADLDRGLREATRVLRPGGVVVVLEFSEPRRWPVRPLFLWYFRRVLPAIGRIVSGHRDAYRYLPASVRTFSRPEELARRLESAGCAGVRWEGLTFGIATLYWGRVQ
jgi:demethylmenaquinone methyltransferase/2-methoxy-6-polyprenyl-1,4-benzoquinol methylase